MSWVTLDSKDQSLKTLVHACGGAPKILLIKITNFSSVLVHVREFQKLHMCCFCFVLFFIFIITPTQCFCLTGQEIETLRSSLAKATLLLTAEPSKSPFKTTLPGERGGLEWEGLVPRGTPPSYPQYSQRDESQPRTDRALGTMAAKYKPCCPTNNDKCTGLMCGKDRDLAASCM